MSEIMPLNYNITGRQAATATTKSVLTDNLSDAPKLRSGMLFKSILASHNERIDKLFTQSNQKTDEDSNAIPVTTASPQSMELSGEGVNTDVLLYLDSFITEAIKTQAIKITPPHPGDGDRENHLTEQLAEYALDLLMGELEKILGKKTIRDDSSIPQPANQASVIAPLETPELHSGDVDATNCNILGNLKLVDVWAKVLVMLQAAQKISNAMHAQALTLAITCAKLAGDSLVNAASKASTGSIAAGVLNAGLQLGSTAYHTNALTKENRSITKNLGAAREEECTAQVQERGMHSDMPSDERTRAQGLVATHHDKADEYRGNHEAIKIDSSKARARADTVNTLSSVTNQAATKGAEVSAAQESKEGELARANQFVDQELASTQKETARKAAETQDSLTQSLSSAQTNNNGAVSSIADHIH